jgi:hypothetical protein
MIQAVSDDGTIAIEWDEGIEGDRDGWVVWLGKPGWLGPQPYQWRESLIQEASLIYKDYDTSKRADDVLRAWCNYGKPNAGKSIP